MNYDQLKELKRIKEGYKRYHHVTWRTQKEVYCVTTDEEFSSISEAARALNLNRRCIMKVCNGEQPNTQGYVFKYIE